MTSAMPLLAVVFHEGEDFYNPSPDVVCPVSFYSMDYG